MSFTEIAVEIAEIYARENGLKLDTFSLDGVEVEGDEATLVVSANFRPDDQIPFDRELD